VEVAVQVNGKVAGKVTVGIGATEDEVGALALSEPRVREHLAGKRSGRRSTCRRSCSHRGELNAPSAPGLLLLLFGAAACGYRLQPEGKGRFPDSSVVIELSRSRTISSEPDAGSYVAARLREELRRRGFVGRSGGSAPISR
jgi:leucyl-tRNA synthetase